MIPQEVLNKNAFEVMLDSTNNYPDCWQDLWSDEYSESWLVIGEKLREHNQYTNWIDFQKSFKGTLLYLNNTFISIIGVLLTYPNLEEIIISYSLEELKLISALNKRADMIIILQLLIIFDKIKKKHNVDYQKILKEKIT